MDTNSPLIVDLIRDMRARDDDRARLDEARRLGGLEQRIIDMPNLIAREVREQLDPQIATLRADSRGLLERVVALTEKISAQNEFARSDLPQAGPSRNNGEFGRGNGNWWQIALVNTSQKLVMIIGVLVAGVIYVLSQGKIIAPM